MDEIDLAAERAETFNAAAIKAALARQEAPLSTGICQSCHASIEPERLQANPRARLCMDCADEEEAAARRARLRGPR